MSKTALWVIAGLIVLGGGYAVIHAHKRAPEMNPAIGENGTSAPLETTNPNAKKVAFSQFVQQGGSYKCTVHQAMSDMDTGGTVYVSDGKISGDFNTVAEGKPMDTHFMVKDGYTYTWSSAMPSMGFKMKAAAAGGDASASASGTYSWNASQIGDYDCVVWTPTASSFDLPTGVSFRDMSAMQMPTHP